MYGICGLFYIRLYKNYYFKNFYRMKQCKKKPELENIKSYEDIKYKYKNKNLFTIYENLEY